MEDPASHWYHNTKLLFYRTSKLFLEVGLPIHYLLFFIVLAHHPPPVATAMHPQGGG